MKGFSLTEVLISLAISGVIFAGFLKFTAQSRNQFSRARDNMNVRSGVSFTHAEMALLARALEPEFWDRYPLNDGLIHPGGHGHHGVQFHGTCVDQPDSGCAILWDIKAVPEDPVIYQIDGSWQPDRFRISPIDTSYPVGPTDAIGPMSVLLFSSQDTSFCSLIQAVAGGEIMPVPVSVQPWEQPLSLVSDNFEVFHLGRLDVLHCGLQPDPPRNKKIAYQPWSVIEGIWQPGRRKSSHGYLESLVWVACADNRPDRLVLVGQHQDADPRQPPLSIGTRLFGQEVVHAALEF